MWGLSITHWAVVACLVMVLFGRGKISSVMKDLGGGLREFKRGLGALAGADDDEPPAQLKDQRDV